MDQNDLIKNLYLNPIMDEAHKLKPSRRLKPRELATKEKESESNPNLPFVVPYNKGGNVIIQNWNTRTEIPPEIPFSYLPIIIDPRKLMLSSVFKKSIPELSDKPELKQNESSFASKRLIDKGEKLIGQTRESLVKRPNLWSSVSFNDTANCLVPYEATQESSNEQIMPRKEENELVSLDIKPLVTRSVTSPPAKTSLIKKKEIIDFTIYNRYLYLKDNEFLYCKRVGNPIQFVECVYSDLMPKKDKKSKKVVKKKQNFEYITISKNTVMQYVKGACTIYSVPEWIDFNFKFKKLLSIRLFKNYRTAKLFDLWKKFYKKSMKTLYTEKLKKNFSHIDPSLLAGIMEIRTLLKEMSSVNIFKLDMRDPVTLTKFQEDHKSGLRELDSMIEHYRRNVKRIIEKACGVSYDLYKNMKKITLEDNIAKGKESKDEANRTNASGMKDVAASSSRNNVKNTNENSKNVEPSFIQNFLKDSMPYAQDATRRTHYKKLLKYIRVMDFLFNEAKYAMVKNSLQNLSDKFTRLYESYLNNGADSPILVVYDLPLHDLIHYIPHMEQIQKSIFEEFIQEKIYTVIYRKSFIDPQEFPNYMVCFEEVFEVSVDQNSNLNLRIKEDNEISLLFHKIKKNFENCHQALEIFTKEQIPILTNYNTYMNINFKALKEDAHPEELKSLLNKFIEESKTIAQKKVKRNVGIFQFSMGNLLDKVQKMPAKWISDMRELIPQVLVNKLKSLITILNRDLKRLTIQIIDVETFISLKTSVKEISEQKENIDTKNSDINDILNIISDDKEIKIAEFDAKYIREKESLYVEFEKKLSDMGYFIENNISKYKKELRDNITRFDKEVKNLMEELNVDTLNVFNEENYSAIFYIENKSVAIKKLIDKKDFFKKQEDAIEIDYESNFENLANLVYEYELKSKLWDSVREFQEMTKVWESNQVMELSIVDMEEHINKWIEIGRITEVDLENPNVPRVLLQKTKNFDSILPVIKAFQNENVYKEEKFRSLIKSTLKTDFDLKDHGFTLEKLMTLPEIFNSMADLLELNNRANEEKRLIDIFNEVKENFIQRRIPLKMERSNKPQNNEKGNEKWVIYNADYELEYEWIEDKLMTLKKTLLSPYSEVIRERVNKQLGESLKYLHFLDEFHIYQRFSSTVDSIFTPENLREMPSEYKRYLNESIVKTVTKQLKENSNLNRYVEYAHQKVFPNLLTINKNYEEFFAYVEEFLEHKRRECLKYYLISNDELLEMLANPESNEVKNKYIPKLMQGIKYADIGTEADEVIKLTTTDEEQITIKLIKGRHFKDIIESIENDIGKKLRNSFKSFKKDYEASQKSKSQKKPKDVLMDIIKNRDNLGQAIFNFMYSFFIDAIEKALNTDDVFDKIIDIKIESKERKKNMIKSLRDLNATKLDRKILINQISLENYFNELVKNLIREDCNSITDFNWLKILQIKIDSDQLFIKIFTSQNFEYGYEYVGLHNNFIMAPHTERMYVTIANCFTLKKPFFMYGLGESGKKETMSTLARLFGKSMFMFNCSEQFDVKSYLKLLYPCIRTGSWLCLDRIDLISTEMLSVVAQEIMNMYRTLSDKDPSIEIRGERFVVEKSIQVFCMNNLSSKGRVAVISGNIKNYFRLIGSCVPDLHLFISLSLKNLGLSKVKISSRKILFLIEYLNTKISSLKYKRVCLNLFNRVLHDINKEINKIHEENINKFIRATFEKTFGPLLTEEENEDMLRLITATLGQKEIDVSNNNNKLTQKNNFDSRLEDLIKEIVDSYNFKGDKGLKYISKIKEVYLSLEDKDFYLFVGPNLSGKSEAMDILIKVIYRQKYYKQFEEEYVKIVKIFPKAYDSLFLFSEDQKYSKIQFYNVFFNNQIKLLNQNEFGVINEITGSSNQNSPDKKLLNSIMNSSSNDFISDGFKLNDADKDNTTNISQYKFLYFDGQIDPTWIDHLNLIHGNHENRKHCMPNGDTMTLNDFKVVFETSNLIYATPSFITSNFIVNFDCLSYSHGNILYNWINNNKKIMVNIDLKNYIRGLFENYFPKMVEFIQNNKLQIFNFNENFLMKNFISLFDSILPEYNFNDKLIGKKNLNAVPKIEIIKKSSLSIFIFSLAWSLSFFTNFILKTKIEKFISDIFKADDLKGPIFDYFIDDIKHDFELWGNKIDNNEDFKSEYELSIKDTSTFTYNKLFIPAVENIPYQWIVEKLLSQGHPVFYTGNVGTGKSLLLNSLLNDLSRSNVHFYNIRYMINYSTTSKKIENFLLQNLHYVKRELTGDLFDRKVILFIDDCNLQKKDSYQSQSTLECLRQIISTKALYDMKTNIKKGLSRLNLLCCGNIMSYAKNINTDRFLHAFTFVSQNNYSEETLVHIFKYTLEHHIKGFIPTTSSITTNQFVTSTLNLHEYLKTTFKLSPRKLHYRFHMRDVTKIFQSVHDFKFEKSPSEYGAYLEKLWFFKNSRIYEDRMSKEDDKLKLRKESIRIYNTVYKKNHKLETFFNPNLHYLFGVDIIEDYSKDKEKYKDKEGDNENTINNTNNTNNVNTMTSKNKKYVYYEDTATLFPLIKSKIDEYHKSSKYAHIILNKSVFDLILKIIRIFQFNKGHLIQIGPSLSGKMSIAHFAGYVLNKDFYTLDDKHLTKLDGFIKNIIINCSYKNTQSVLFISNSMLMKDEVLETINLLINTREVLNHFDITKTVEKDFGAKLEDKEIFSRLEKNLNISMSAFPQSVSYKKLFYEYTYISKHSNVIYIEQWLEPTYLNLVNDNVSNVSLLNEKFSNFGSLFYEIHEFICTLANEYSNQVMCKINISTKVFTETVLFYEQNINIYREILMSQKRKYEIAADAVSKTMSMISKINEELEKLEPEKLDIEKSIDERKSEFSKKQIQKTQITNMKNEEEKPLQLALNQKDEIKDKVYKNLEDSIDRVTKTSKDLNRVQRSELLEFKNYIDNHTLSKYLLCQIYAFQGETSEYDFVKKNLDIKYIHNLVNMDYSNAPANLVKFVKEVVANPDFTTSENLQKIFKICGYMSDWLAALNEYFNEYEKQKTLMDDIEELNKKIFEHEKIIKNHTDNLIEISKQIADIERELQGRDKKKQQTISHIEKREALKKIGEEFIEVVKEKYELWNTKKDAVNVTLSNMEFYMIFISVYINYAPPFNSSYRKKIKNFLFKKAESLFLRNLTHLTFYNLMLEFIDLKVKDKDLILSLGTFDDYTKENFLIMHLNKKTPYILDNNRVSKWSLSEYILSREPKRLIFTKPYEVDFMDKVDTALKDGHYLFIEQSNERMYTLMKSVIKEEKVVEKGKTYVTIDGSLKEYNEKFKLFFIKDKIDTQINSKVWLECLVINFIPSTDQIVSSLLKELLINEDEVTWNNFTHATGDLLKENSRLMDVEDRLINILNQFDFTGNIEKNSSNQNFLSNYKYESNQHSHFLSLQENNKEKLFKFKTDVNKYKELAEDGARIYKWMAKFIFLDNIYNFSFAVFSKYIKEFYKEKILSKTFSSSTVTPANVTEYTQENLLELIMFLYEKVALLFSYDQRKLLLFVLILFYLSRKGDIPKNYKQTFYLLKTIFFDKELDTDNHNEESPIKSIPNFEWNCLKEINNKANNLLFNILEHIQTNPDAWEKTLSTGVCFNEGITLTIDKELDEKTNLLAKIIFYVVIAPYRMEQLLRELFESVIGDNFKMPILKLAKALSLTPPRKVILIIDNDYLSEKEIIIYYRKRYGLESTNFYKHINLDSEMTSSSFEVVNNAIKTGLLVIVRNIQYAKQSIIKIFEVLNDTKTLIHDSFRLVFISKSNIILSSLIYENCVLINRNIPSFSTFKDTIQDSIDNVDVSHFEYIVNRKYNTLHSRKIVFHLLIAHTVLCQFQHYHAGIYNNPIEYSKKDFLNAFYFLSGYLNALGEDKENLNNSPTNYSNNNYAALLNVVFDSFYCNRLVYVNEIHRVMKILQRYFEEDKFFNENTLFLFKDEKSANSVSIRSDTIPILSTEEICEMIDEIPLEDYYQMIVNIPMHIVNEKLTIITKDIFNEFAMITSMSNTHNAFTQDGDTLNVDIEMEKFQKVVTTLKGKLPCLIVIFESSSLTFKVNKKNEFINPIDESLRFEFRAYNKYLIRIMEDIEIMNKIFNNEIILDDEYYQMMMDISQNRLPSYWLEECFNFNRIETCTLAIWAEKLNERFECIRQWILESSLSVYNANLFYNLRLFLYSIRFYFAKKANVSPELIKLKFLMTKYYKREDMNSDENYTLEINQLVKNREIIYCNGFVIENAFLMTNPLRLADEKEGDKRLFEACPMIGITYTLEGEADNNLLDEEEEEDEEAEEMDQEGLKYVNIHIYDRNNPKKFENIEPLGYLELGFESKYKEDYWITKAVKISLDF